MDYQAWEDGEEETREGEDTQDGDEEEGEGEWEDDLNIDLGDREFYDDREWPARPVPVRGESIRGATMRITRRVLDLSVDKDEAQRTSFQGKGKQKEEESRLQPMSDAETERLKGYDSNGDVEFDSSDEDECEEIFAGTWDREVVRVRRKRRAELERKKTGA